MVARNNADSEPKLAPPGAGLPTPELQIARLLFRLRQWSGNRDAFTARFQRERGLIRALVLSCDAGSGSRRVLIERPRGLEDSSRNWSVWMTLDHLRIVNGEITRVVDALSKGVAPKGVASTAAVKPGQGITEAVVAAYEDSCDAYLAAVAAAPDLDSALSFPHPWFGPLNAAGWHALSGAHMGIHREQIQRILTGLRQ